MAYSNLNFIACLNMLALVTMTAASTAPLENSPRLTRSLALTYSHAQFCGEVQRRLSGTILPLENIVNTQYDAFVLSKPQVAPLQTHQYVQRDAQKNITQISCKTKSSDHLHAIRGTLLIKDRSCQNIQSDIVNEVWASLTPEQRLSAAHKPGQIMLEPDEIQYTGSRWVKASANLYIDFSGRPHLKSSALFAEWRDWRWKLMPKLWRGNHYCHLIAPERVRKLLLKN